MNELNLFEAMGDIKKEYRQRAFAKPRIVQHKTHRIVAAACFLLIAGAAFGLARGIKAPEKAGAEQSIAAEITEVAEANVTEAAETQTTAAAQTTVREANAPEKTEPARSGVVSGGGAGAEAGPGTVAAQPVSPSEPEDVPEIVTDAAAETTAQTETTAARTETAAAPAEPEQTEPEQTEPEQPQTEPAEICLLAKDAAVHATYSSVNGGGGMPEEQAALCYDWIRGLGIPEVYVRPMKGKYFEMTKEGNQKPAVLLTFDEPQSMTVYDLEAGEYRTRDNITGLWVRKVEDMYYIVFMNGLPFDDGFTVIELTDVPDGWYWWN